MLCGSHCREPPNELCNIVQWKYILYCWAKLEILITCPRMWRWFCRQRLTCESETIWFSLGPLGITEWQVDPSGWLRITLPMWIHVAPQRGLLYIQACYWRCHVWCLTPQYCRQRPIVVGKVSVWFGETWILPHDLDMIPQLYPTWGLTFNISVVPNLSKFVDQHAHSNYHVKIVTRSTQHVSFVDHAYPIQYSYLEEHERGHHGDNKRHTTRNTRGLTRHPLQHAMSHATRPGPCSMRRNHAACTVRLYFLYLCFL